MFAAAKLCARKLLGLQAQLTLLGEHNIETLLAGLHARMMFAKHLEAQL